MADPLRPSRQADQFQLRLPEGMRERIAEASKVSGRSMNAEIIARLQRSFSEEPVISGVSMVDLFAKLDQIEAAIKSGDFTPFTKTAAGKEWKASQEAKTIRKKRSA